MPGRQEHRLGSARTSCDRCGHLRILFMGLRQTQQAEFCDGPGSQDAVPRQEPIKKITDTLLGTGTHRSLIEVNV